MAWRMGIDYAGRRCVECGRFIRGMTVFTNGKCMKCRNKASKKNRARTVSRSQAIRAIAKTCIGLMICLNSGICGEVEYGIASWYSSKDACCTTADGSDIRGLEQRGELFAASWDYDFGTHLKVTSLATGNSVEVVVRDRGPSRSLGRIIDLGRDAFEEIGELERGLIRVSVEELYG